MSQPSLRSILEVLPKSRLAAVGRELGVAVPASGIKEAQIEILASSQAISLPDLLHSLGRDELRAACRTRAEEEKRQIVTGPAKSSKKGKGRKRKDGGQGSLLE